ncbi:hypothetical protein [Rhizobium phage RHph_X3_2]|nr:hypothetical protein [Rhizobium phage RHph_X3_2]
MSHTRGKVNPLDDGSLNDMAQLVAKQEFEALHPEHKVKIIDLVLKQQMMEDLHEIRCWFEVSRTFDGI